MKFYFHKNYYKLNDYYDYKSLNNFDKINSLKEDIKTSFNNISELSHFYILFNNWNKFIPFQFNIEGKINNNYIIQVITKKSTLKWKDYLLLYISFLNKNYNPCISENKFLYLLHTYSFIDELNIRKLILDNNVIIEIKYTKDIKYNLFWNEKLSKKINKPNHFYFESFNVNQNRKNLKTEMTRFFQDTQLSNICLVGSRDSYLKNAKNYH